MTRNPKRLGLIVASVLAIGAIGASTAHAVEGEFTAAEYPATIKSEQVKAYELKIAGKTVICKKANSTSVEFKNLGIYTDKFTYFECSVGAMPATVTMNGCDYERKAKPKRVTISCPPLKNIEVHVYADAAKHANKQVLCEYFISAQEGLEGVEYTNTSGLVEDLLIDDNLKSIKYTVEGSKLLCGSNGENGELIGSATYKAFNEGEKQIAYMVG
jgi:hypothetical protein